MATTHAPAADSSGGTIFNEVADPVAVGSGLRWLLGIGAVLIVAGASLLYLFEGQDATGQDDPSRHDATGDADPLIIGDGLPIPPDSERAVRIRHMGEEYLAEALHAKRIVLDEDAVASNPPLQRVMEAGETLGQYQEKSVYMSHEENQELATYLWGLELAGENYSLEALHEWKGRLYDITYHVYGSEADWRERVGLRIEYSDPEIAPERMSRHQVNLTGAQVNRSEPLRYILGIGAELDHGWHADVYFHADDAYPFFEYLFDLQQEAGGGSGTVFYDDERPYRFDYPWWF